MHLPFLLQGAAEKRTLARTGFQSAWLTTGPFTFTIRANLDELKGRGCDLILFSPLQTRNFRRGSMPSILGEAILRNMPKPCRKNSGNAGSVRQFARRGLPLYAECGGLMYLTLGIETPMGKRYPWWDFFASGPKAQSFEIARIRPRSPSPTNSLGESAEQCSEATNSITRTDRVSAGCSRLLDTSLQDKTPPLRTILTARGFSRTTFLASYVHLQTGPLNLKTSKPSSNHCGANPVRKTGVLPPLFYKEWNKDRFHPSHKTETF